jgi:hypothetical protein
VLIPALSLIIALAVTVFWLTGCTSLQMLNATVSHRGYSLTHLIDDGYLPCRISLSRFTTLV